MEDERLVWSASEIWGGSERTVSASLKVQIDLGYTLSINPGEAFNYVYLSLGIFMAMLAFWIGALGALNSLMILVFLLDVVGPLLVVMVVLKRVIATVQEQNYVTL